ncbi:MAG: lytic murein transglycosylase B [Pseudomonadota bacterium]
MIRLLLPLLLLLALPAQSARPAGYAERDDVRAFVADMEARHAIDAATLTALFARTEPIPAVLKAIRPPADPGVKSWQAYRARFVEPRRLAAGLDFWAEHQATLAKAQALSGVPAEIIVAIIGIETFYGRYLGRFETFAALATLAFDYPPRADLFRRQLEALLLLAREEGRAPDSYRGSYAGAIGLPQFLPSSIRAYAVDFDHYAGIDLVDSPADAIGSVANFLREHGWEQDGPIAVPAKVSPGGAAAQLVEEGITPARRPAEMAAHGVAAPADAPDAPAALIDLATPRAETEYWLGYRNFYVITRYNRSSFYAMTVFQFAQALREQHAGKSQSRRDGGGLLTAAR